MPPRKKPRENLTKSTDEREPELPLSGGKMIEKWHHPKNAAIAVYTVAFEVPPRGLLVKSFLSQKGYARVQVYDPEKKLIGEILHGFDRGFESLCTGEHHASLNGRMGKLSAGEYQIKTEYFAEDFPVTWALQIEETPCEGLMALECMMEEPWFEGADEGKTTGAKGRYYKGDLHGHTTLSDGDLNPVEALAVMAQQSLDFMALTEHNRVAFGQRRTPVILIPSFELTLPEGHLNIHGVDDPEIFKAFQLDGQAMVNTVRYYRSRANVSLNHMFLDPWAYTDKTLHVKDIHTLEIICDPTYRDSLRANQKSLDFLKYLWNRGFQVYGIGGSDAHNRPENHYPGAGQPSIYGDPATYVYAAQPTVRGILAGIRVGDVVVSRYFKPLPDIAEGNIRPGSALEELYPFDYLVTFEGFEKPRDADSHTWQFVFNGAVIDSGTLTGQPVRLARADLVFKSSRTSFNWLAFEVRNESGEVISWINPIYSGALNPSNPALHLLIREFSHDTV